VLDPGRDAVLSANRCACSLLGYNIDELMALSVSAVFLAEGGALEAFLEAIVRQGEDSTTTVGLRAKSGTVIPAELLALRFRSDGQRFVLVLANLSGPERSCPV
jgi:PAS domain S-box-containing protein